MVHACVTRSPWTSDYDLVYGLAGLGVYSLERLPRALARTSLERIVDRLAETATHSAAGVAWHTGPELLGEARAEFPGGYENLGLAHGVPGVIALLGRILAAGIAMEKARPLLAGAVAWLLAQKGKCGGGSLFPNWIAEGHEPSASRAAWCYGDPGVAAALFVAARGAGEPAWEAEAVSIARAAAARAPETAFVKDAGICHGAAGLGHIYNRLFQATGEHSLGEAAEFWLEHALALRRLGEEVAGFPAWRPAFGGAPARWEAEAGLLVGAAGVAIALAAATSSVEPAWDRVFLLSGPTCSDREGL
jgi:hypothetical protein